MRRNDVATTRYVHIGSLAGLVTVFILMLLVAVLAAAKASAWVIALYACLALVFRETLVFGFRLADEVLLRNDMYVAAHGRLHNIAPAVFAAGVSLAAAAVLPDRLPNYAVVAIGVAPTLCLLAAITPLIWSVYTQSRFNLRRRERFAANCLHALEHVADKAGEDAFWRIQRFLASQTGRLADVAEQQVGGVADGLEPGRETLAAAITSVPLRGFTYPGIPARPTHPHDQFTWMSPLLDAFDDLKIEAMQACANIDRLETYPLLELSHWRSVPLIKGGQQIDGADALCPLTCELLNKHIPHGGVREAILSVMTKGVLKPHVDITIPFWTVHLPLLVQGPCGIRIGNELHVWTEGQPVIIDGTHEHEAWSHVEAIRINLMFDFWPPGLTEYERTFFTELYRRQLGDHIPHTDSGNA